jgi:hypothetical protein
VFTSTPVLDNAGKGLSYTLGEPEQPSNDYFESSVLYVTPYILV